jgi:hypothetical protein
MAIKKFICPPTPASGSGTFSDDLVGFQLVQGGGLTQGNFQFTNAVTEKVDRTFYTGVFSDPINLENLGIVTVEQSKFLHPLQKLLVISLQQLNPTKWV